MKLEFMSYDPIDAFTVDISFNDIEKLKKYMSKLTKALPEINRVVFNERATIILWADGDKTVVKLGKGEVNDPEKGMAMAICKKVFGDTGSYYEIFKKWLPTDTKVTE